MVASIPGVTAGKVVIWWSLHVRPQRLHAIGKSQLTEKADLDGPHGTHWQVRYIQTWQTAALRGEARPKRRRDNPNEQGEITAQESKIKENALFYFLYRTTGAILLILNSSKYETVCQRIKETVLWADLDWKAAENIHISNEQLRIASKRLQCWTRV